MRLIFLPAVLLILGLVSGCGNGSTPDAASTQSTPATPDAAPSIPSAPRKTTFVLFRSNLSARQGAALLAGASQSAKDHHNSFVIKFEDAPATADTLSALDVKDTDVVILSSTGSASATGPVLSAKFPIVYIDASMEGVPGVASLATDDNLAGEMAAQEFTKLLGGGGEVAIAKEPPYTPRTAAFAAAATTSGLKTYRAEEPGRPAAVAIYCPDESATRTMLKTLAGANVSSDCKVIGFGLADDLLDALRAGKLEALVIPDYFETGHSAAEAARAAIVGEDKPGTPHMVKVIPPVLLTKTSLDDPAIQAHLGL